MQIAFPLHFDESGRTASASEEAHIRQMIEQLLLTGEGERVNRPTFGSGLLQFVFAANSPEFASALETSMHAKLEQYLGDVIAVEHLQVTAEDSALHVSVDYSLRRTGEPQRAQFTGRF